jgi:hypothetical protein
VAENFTLEGFWRSEPKVSGAAASGCPTLHTPTNEKVLLAKKQFADVALDADPAEAVPFGDLTNAHVVMIKTNRKVTVRLTTTEGATQIVPVDTVLQLISESVPYTAIDLQRVVGQSTSVKVFLGEKN